MFICALKNEYALINSSMLYNMSVRYLYTHNYIKQQNTNNYLLAVNQMISTCNRNNSRADNQKDSKQLKECEAKICSRYKK